jgi:hypothetical protein
MDDPMLTQDQEIELANLISKNISYFVFNKIDLSIGFSAPDGTAFYDRAANRSFVLKDNKWSELTYVTIDYEDTLI